MREEADIDGGFAGIFGKIAGRISRNTATSPTRWRMIAAKNHKNGVANPYAQMRKDLGFEFCRTESEKNPFVAGPLKRTDCSLVSDGAAALVLADVETALQFDKAVAFRAAEHVQDFLPMSQARHPQVRRLRGGLAARARQTPASRSATCPSSRRTTASPSPN